MLALGYVDYSVLGGYLLLMLAVGYICRNISKNLSDYVRMGCKSTWWLMGLSLFMMSFSAATFTGLCAQSFLGGWSGMITTWSAALGLFVQGLLFAPWMRRLRPITPGDIIRLRFGRAVEQIFVYVGAMSPLVWGGFMLLGLSKFTAIIFDVNVYHVILFAGVVVIIYSVSGGSWSVQITDNLQSFILIPVTIVVAVLSLQAIGGLDGLRNEIDRQGLTDEFKLVKPPGYAYPAHKQAVNTKLDGDDEAEILAAAQKAAGVTPVPITADDIQTNAFGQKYIRQEKEIQIGKFVGKGYHTWPWLLALVIFGVIGTANPTMAYRYLSAKDEKAARNAALLAGGLMLFGSLIWFIPPMVGRLLFADDIFGSGVKNPGEVAYAMVAQRVLPPGVLGLILIAMFSASMSSMDSNLTGTAGLITNNIYPPLCRLFGWKEWTGKKLLRLTQGFNLMLGLWAMTAAILMETYGSRVGLFKYMFDVMILIGAPITTPFLLAFFVKKLPPWGPLVGTAVGFLFSAFFLFNKDFFWLLGEMGMPGVGEAFKGDLSWVFLWHNKIWIMTVAILVPTLLTCLWWPRTSRNYREKHVDEFFRRIKTPIDFEKEVGQAADTQQLKLVGGLGIIMGVFILPLLFFARNDAGAIDWPGFWSVAFIGGFVVVVSGVLYWVGVRGSHSTALDTTVAEEPEYGVAFAHSDEDKPIEIEDHEAPNPED